MLLFDFVVVILICSFFGKQSIHELNSFKTSAKNNNMIYRSMLCYCIIIHSEYDVRLPVTTVVNQMPKLYL